MARSKPYKHLSLDIIGILLIGYAAFSNKTLQDMLEGAAQVPYKYLKA